MDVREPTAEELLGLARIEQDADQLYIQEFGDAAREIFERAPTLDGPARSARPGFVLVVGDPVAGFSHVLEEDGQAHLEQLSVLRSAQQQGLGSALLRSAMRAAASRGHTELSLCTYASLPWNEPFYRRFGFVPHSWDTPWRQRLLAAEEAEGLPRHGHRLLMVALLTPVRVGA